jgi:hypothetical protein
MEERHPSTSSSSSVQSAGVPAGTDFAVSFTGEVQQLLLRHLYAGRPSPRQQRRGGRVVLQFTVRCLPCSTAGVPQSGGQPSVVLCSFQVPLRALLQWGGVDAAVPLCGPNAGISVLLSAVLPPHRMLLPPTTSCRSFLSQAYVLRPAGLQPLVVVERMSEVAPAAAAAASAATLATVATVAAASTAATTTHTAADNALLIPLLVLCCSFPCVPPCGHSTVQ